MAYPLTFLLGAIISFVASLPIGAVNMAVVQTTLNRGRKNAYLIGLGAIIVEAIYCGLPLFGLTFMLDKNSPVFHGIFLASIPLLIFLGIYTIVMRKKAAIRAVRGGTSGGGRNYILYGATLCATNPMVLFFWAQITIMLRNLELLNTEILTLSSFLIGVPAGTFFLYYIFVYIAHKQKKKISLRTRVKMNMAVGIIFLGLGAYLIVNYIVKMTKKEETTSAIMLPSEPSSTPLSQTESGTHTVAFLRV